MVRPSHKGVATFVVLYRLVYVQWPAYPISLRYLLVAHMEEIFARNLLKPGVTHKVEKRR